MAADVADGSLAAYQLQHVGALNLWSVGLGSCRAPRAGWVWQEGSVRSWCGGRWATGAGLRQRLRQRLRQGLRPALRWASQRGRTDRSAGSRRPRRMAAQLLGERGTIKPCALHHPRRRAQICRSAPSATRCMGARRWPSTPWRVAAAVVPRSVVATGWLPMANWRCRSLQRSSTRSPPCRPSSRSNCAACMRWPPCWKPRG